MAKFEVKVDGNDITFDSGTKDWTYMQDKSPSSVHEMHAAIVSAASGVEVTPKQVQAVLGMHGAIQKSDANKQRKDYKGRTAQSIHKGGQTLVERLEESGALEETPATPAPEEPKAAPKTPAKPKAPAKSKTPAKPKTAAQKAPAKPKTAAQKATSKANKGASATEVAKTLTESK